MSDRPLRLGEVIEDYCPRCRLLLNHDIASLAEGAVAKVTCRTCYNTHDYRHGQVPTRRKPKETKKSLIDQVLAGIVPPPAPTVPVPQAPPPTERKKRDLWAEVERLKKK